MVKRALSAGMFGLVACLLLNNTAVAEDASADGGGAAADNLNARIHRQLERINHGVKLGAINADQANKLRASVQSLQNQVAAKRQPDGSLKKEDLTQFENLFNQNSNMIHSLVGAGERKSDGGNALGPGWTAGKDGAQNPNSLLKEMKAENRRELRQERQAIEQKIEQQQLDYEHQMIPELANQKKSILNGKQQLKDIRKEQNAN
ncbi:MAG: hypothetical protein IT342_17795 [Candidatus Melainabacteria bacterium]|nr:hypothetical protein [Candidatus Melainabacteria bacterium]